MKQSGNQWNKKLNKFLVDCLKFRRLKTDSCVYVRGSSVRDRLIIAVYVDDILIYARDLIMIEEFKSAFKREFEIDDIGECRKVIGMKVECKNDTIELKQTDFVMEVLRESKMGGYSSVGAPLDPGAKLEMWKQGAWCRRRMALQEHRRQIKFSDKGAISLASNNGYSARTKHIDVRQYFKRELVELGRIELEYVNTKENLADLCTKALTHSTHIYLRDLIVQDVCK